MRSPRPLRFQDEDLRQCTIHSKMSSSIFHAHPACLLVYSDELSRIQHPLQSLNFPPLCTATPAKNDKHWRHAAIAGPRKRARGGHLRTTANPLKRFPYALPFAMLQASQAMIEAARDISFL